MIESGVSQREAARLLGVSQSTIRDDLSRNHSKSEGKSLTGSDATKAHQKARPVGMEEPAGRVVCLKQIGDLGTGSDGATRVTLP
jgi:IS30 family transposase